MRFFLAFISVLAAADLALNHGTAVRAVEAAVPDLVAQAMTSWRERSE